ncbi:MAG: hypothetical protein EOO68_15970 [Moraxellaceae bacterium]|jgi:hypothetical protein|nr:MAG: hypothetical protein EOO68_15970 [Moraxellaceae bacterium]
MLLDHYQKLERLQNSGVKGATTEANTFAFRGDLVLEQGDIADVQGRRLPPKSVVKQAALLIANDKIRFLCGNVHDLAGLELLHGLYGEDYAPDVCLFIYVENIKSKIKLTLNGYTYTCLPIEEMAVWSALMDDLRLDKEDFKGCSNEDKVIVMYRAAVDFQYKGDVLPFAEALGLRVAATKSQRGPV